MDHLPARPFVLRVAAVLFLVPFMAAALGAAEGDSPYSSLATRAEAIAGVEFILQIKMGGMGGDQEMERKVNCPVIDPEGLLLCSNTELGGFVSVMGAMMGGDVSATPSDLKVSVDGGPAELSARLLARDTDRDLAWVMIEDPSDEGYPFFDLEGGVEAAPGDLLFSLRLMDPFFGRAPVVATYRVGAVLSKPRPLLVPESPVVTGYGMPIFTASGELVGFTVLQQPGEEDQSGAMFPMGFGGQSSKLQDMTGGLVLPVAEVRKATALAREIFAEDVEAMRAEQEGDESTE